MSGRSQQALLAEGLARQGHVAPAVEACYEALRNDDADPLVHALLADLFLDRRLLRRGDRAATPRHRTRPRLRAGVPRARAWPTTAEAACGTSRSSCGTSLPRSCPTS